MARIRRVALFSIPDHFYINMMLGLKRGFEALGVEAFVCWPHLSGRDLASFVDNYRPDVVIEMDRFRDQIAGFEEPVPHVAWVLNHVVFGRRVYENASGSAAVYMVTDPAEVGFSGLTPGSYGFLLPACDPAIFQPRPVAPRFNFSFIGHMYAPLSEEVLSTPIRLGGVKVAELREIVEDFMVCDIHHWNFHMDKVHAFVRNFFRRRGFEVDAARIPADLLFLLDEYLVRYKDRRRVVDGLLAVSRQVGFFGNPEWATWPELAPYYRGTLFRASDLVDTICATRVNVHNGTMSMHMRVMDVMGCGMPLMVNCTVRDRMPYGIESHFTPGEHYIPYDLGEVEEVAARALRDEAWRKRIGEAARQRVLEQHTWRHRAEFLLRDLAQRL